MKPTLTASLLAALALSSQAAVTLTFDSDLEGFEAQEHATTLVHSTVNGGSMQLTANGGWAGNSSKVNLRANAAVWDEVQRAAANGGILGFDVTVVGSEQQLTASPAWFELVVIGNSTNAGAGGTGGWDQNVVGIGIGSASWPLDPDSQTINVSLPIGTTPAIANDGSVWLDTVGSGWTELHLGVNSEAAGLTEATIYIDNVSVSANAVPEPTSALLVGLGGLGLLARRRR